MRGAVVADEMFFFGKYYRGVDFFHISILTREIHFTMMRIVIKSIRPISEVDTPSVLESRDTSFLHVAIHINAINVTRIVAMNNVVDIVRFYHPVNIFTRHYVGFSRLPHLQICCSNTCAAFFVRHKWWGPFCSLDSFATVDPYYKRCAQLPAKSERLRAHSASRPAPSMKTRMFFFFF